MPAGVEQRRGMPQGRHTDVLLAGGAKVLKRYFPGFIRETVADGAVTADLVRDFRWCLEGAPLARPKRGGRLSSPAARSSRTPCAGASSFPEERWLSAMQSAALTRSTVKV